METTSGISWWGIVIILFLLFFTFRGGFGFGNAGFGAGYIAGENTGCDGYGFNNYKATLDAQKSEIINTATTQYKIEEQANATRSLMHNQFDALSGQIEAINTQNLRDKISEQAAEIARLQSEAYTSAALAPLQAQLNVIQSTMAVKPQVYSASYSCPAGAVNGCGCGM